MNVHEPSENPVDVRNRNQRGSRDLSRRTLLGLGAVGGAAVVMTRQTGLWASGSPEQEISDLGVVTHRGVTDAPVRLRVGDRELEVVPYGFLPGWELIEGDKVVVDLGSLTIWPSATFLSADNKGTRTFVTANVESSRQRTFSVRAG